MRIRERDVTDTINDMPQLSTCLGRLLALPATRQRVLGVLVDLSTTDRASVTAAAEAISRRSGIDLSLSTVKRFFYEISESG